MQTQTQTQSLPIEAAKAEIVATVESNLVTIVEAETGAGKSTQVVQYLKAAGYQVTATQPRVMAAINLATRVAKETNTPLGQLTGYRTRLDRKDSAATEILFCTHELQLLREMNDHGHKGPKHVLVIDEVHEWDLALETLVAWVKYQHKQGIQLRVVLMSATVDTGPLSEFFGGAPVISVPGRLYAVKKHFLPLPEETSPEDFAAEIAGDLVADGHHTLVFVRGKDHINAVTGLLEQRFQTAVEIIGLHGEMTLEQQERAFQPFHRPTVIVSTPVAQTSVTIEGITKVVDLGMANRKEVRDGVEGLYLGDVSQSDCLQRAGRAGRVEDGDYYLCSQTPLELRPEYPVPEILRSRLDQLVLRLALLGLDASELEFFHDPDRSELVRAKEALIRLGALSANGEVTETGRAMSSLPVDVHHARMLVEADRRGVTPEVLTIVAAIEAGSVRMKPEKVGPFLSIPAWKKLTAETGSDLLAELDCFTAASSMTKEEMRQNGIHVKNFYKTKNLRARLLRDLGASARRDPEFDRLAVLKSCVAGMVDHLYRHDYERTYVGASIWDMRDADRNTVVTRAEWVTGTPFDLQIINQRGHKMTLKLLTFISEVEPEWLIEVAPHLASSQVQEFRYDPYTESVLEVRQATFNGRAIGELTTPATACPEATLALARALADGAIEYTDLDHNTIVVNRVAMYARRYDHVEYPSTDRIAGFLAERLGAVYRLEDLDQVDLRLERTDLLPADFTDTLPNLDPETITVDGIDCQVVYELPSWATDVYAVISLPAGALDKLSSLPAPSRPVLHSSVHLTEDGEVVASGDSLASLRAELERHRQRQSAETERQAYQSEAEELTAQKSALQDRGRPVEQLSQLIRELNWAIRETTWDNAPSFAEVSTKLEAVKAEIERLGQSSSVVLAEDIMAGRLPHPDVKHNQEVINEIADLSIRTGKFIEPFTPEMLRKHYLDQLAGNPNVEELPQIDLKLDKEKYVIEDPELEVAPDKITLAARKGTSTYEVTYGHETIEDKEVAVGVIRIPLSIYQINVPEHGKTSGYPELPHGILLMVEILDNVDKHKVIARGPLGEALEDKVKKHLKAVRRGKIAPNVDEFGDRRYAPVQATPKPPWFKGR